MTPYHYGLNNPIANIDPTGMWTETATGYSTSDPSEIAAFCQQMGIGQNKKDPEEDEKKKNTTIQPAENKSRAIEKTDTPGMEFYLGTAGAVVGELYYSERYGIWMGKNFKLYKMTINGNGITGGKYKFGKATSTAIKIGGYGHGLWNAYSNWELKQTGQISQSQYNKEQVSNVITTVGGTYGAAWGVGWELGRLVTNTEAYQEAKFNYWYNQIEKRIGPPSKSNETLWLNFYQNY